MEAIHSACQRLENTLFSGEIVWVEDAHWGDDGGTVAGNSAVGVSGAFQFGKNSWNEELVESKHDKSLKEKIIQP